MLLSSKQTRKERSSTEIRDILRGIHFTLQSSSADQERTQGGNSLHHEVATQMSLTMIMLMMVMMMVMMTVPGNDGNFLSQKGYGDIHHLSACACRGPGKAYRGSREGTSTHTRIHTQMHTDIHRCTQIHTDVHRHTHRCTQMYTDALRCTQTYTDTHTCTHTHAHAHTHTYIRTHRNTHTYTLTRRVSSPASSSRHCRPGTHTHIHTHTYTHTHTRPHAPTHMPTLLFCSEARCGGRPHTGTYGYGYYYGVEANREHTAASMGCDAHAMTIEEASQPLRPRGRFEFETFGTQSPKSPKHNAASRP